MRHWDGPTERASCSIFETIRVTEPEDLGRQTLDEDFQNIPTADGTIILEVTTDADGRRQYSTGYEDSAPRPLSLYAIWALRQGIPVGVMRAGHMRGTDPPDRKSTRLNSSH